MITTDFIPGSPCWLDLGAPDVEAAAAFYGKVFGWRAEPFGEQPPGGYTVCRLDGKIVGAIGPLAEDGARPAWTVYFHTTDADSTARAVEQAGGAVRSAPAAVGDNDGRHAQLTDPQGGKFAVWEPAAYPGFEVADGPGSLGWIELFTPDSAAAQRFYGTVFGWTTQDMPLPGGGGAYTLLTPRDSGEERMHGGIMEIPATSLTRSDGQAYWHPVFGSGDCDATIAAITSHGGTLRMGPEDAEGVGRLAVCADPAGAEFVVLTPAAA
ncbi:VOC family protein [Streptomyces sp. NPDC048644]|uniref:VOC family protein n=1 Tax=Streptomyces sp. NPDC048644 TaxID=3365582 RepID=UPI0037157E99